MPSYTFEITSNTKFQKIELPFDQYEQVPTHVKMSINLTLFTLNEHSTAEVLMETRWIQFRNSLGQIYYGFHKKASSTIQLH